MKKTVKIGKGKAIPLAIRLIAIGVLFYVYSLLHEYMEMTPFIIVGIAISPALPAIWSAQKVIEIDPDRKILRKYIWVLGKKIGKDHSFKKINQIILEKVENPKITEVLYISYIVLDESVKIGITRSTEKEKLESKLVSIASKLNVPLKEIP